MGFTQKWMRHRGFCTWGIQTGPFAACWANFVPKIFKLFDFHTGSPIIYYPRERWERGILPKWMGDFTIVRRYQTSALYFSCIDARISRYSSERVELMQPFDRGNADSLTLRSCKNVVWSSRAENQTGEPVAMVHESESRQTGVRGGEERTMKCEQYRYGLFCLRLRVVCDTFPTGLN